MAEFTNRPYFSKTYETYSKGNTGAAPYLQGVKHSVFGFFVQVLINNSECRKSQDAQQCCICLLENGKILLKLAKEKCGTKISFSSYAKL